MSPKSGRGLGHVTPTIFVSTVGYPSDSLASCLLTNLLNKWLILIQHFTHRQDYNYSSLLVNLLVAAFHHDLTTTGTMTLPKDSQPVNYF